MSTIISATILTFFVVSLLVNYFAVKLSTTVIGFTIRLFRKLIQRKTPETRADRSKYQKDCLQKNLAYKDSVRLGIEGENDLYNVLSDIPGKKHILRNLYVPKDDGNTAEIDQILICQSGIYVFEYKNYHCDVVVPKNTDDRNWYRAPYGRWNEEYPFYSPLLQNEGHVEALITYLNSFTGTKGIVRKMFSYIVFSDECNLRNGPQYFNRTGIMNLHDVPFLIDSEKSMETSLFDNAIDTICFMLSSLQDVSCEARDRHVRSVASY